MKKLPVVCIGLSLACGAHAQQATGAGTYQMRVDSRLVVTTLTVRDAKGALVHGLGKDAFHVAEDGTEQKVKYFAQERELPLSIGLLMDASGSQQKFFKDHEDEMQGFLQEVMQPNDRAFAVCFGNHLRLVSDWTSSPKELVDGVHRFGAGDRKMPEVGPYMERELGTALLDAVWFPIEEKMAAEKGRRKVLVIFSDGEENSSEHDEVDAIAQAQGADVLVYALRTTENKEQKMTPRDRYGMRVLDHLTSATGGVSFDVRAMKTKAIFASIVADLKSMYELGYYTTNTVRDGTFRKVMVTVDGDGLKARARAGYIAR